MIKKVITILTISGFVFSLNGCLKQMSESVKDNESGTNGSFEYVKNELPVNWMFYTEKTVESGEFNIVMDTADFKEGNQSVKFHVKNCSDKGGRFSPGFAQEFLIEHGETYTISFWAKVKASKFKAKFVGTTAFNRENEVVLESGDTNGEWKQFQLNYKLPDSMTKLRVDINVMQPGDVWFDDFKIGKL